MGNMIMPSGGNRYDWIPEVSSDENQRKIGVDAISDEELVKLAQFGEIVDVELESPGETPEDEDVVEVSIDEEVPGGMGEADEIEETEDSLEEEAEGDSVDELIEAVEDVKEKLDDVVQDAEEAISGEAGEAVEDEMEEDLGEDIEEISEEDALVAVTPGEMEEEEECPECEYCGAAKGISSVAGDSRTFTKIAAVSPENKKQIAKYWKDYLGYDPEYVDWMLKDYEK